MTYFLTGFLLLAGFLFWGGGLALLATPARYRRFSLIFAAPAGIALQSLTVWVGAHLNLRGTDAYGRAALVVPVVMLVLGWWRWRRLRRGQALVPYKTLMALMVVQLAVMVLPFVLSGRGLTSVSIGSLDAADYAAGARVFQQFAWKDRAGFIGQTEVVSVGVVDNFFDFWLRTNHFTPSALIALNGSILGLKPYQLTGLITIVLLTAALPMVFWLARAGLRFRTWPSLAVTAIYAFSPINWYAVYQVSPAQIVAANAIALLTWCGLAYWREGAGLTCGLKWAGLLFVGYGLVFGGYNFIIVVSLVPVLTYAGGRAFWGKQWGKLGRWLAVMLGLLLVSGLVYYERGVGVAERLVLFKNGFGWAIAVLTPEGWLGFLNGPWLNTYDSIWRIPLAAMVVALITVSLWKSARRRPETVWTALCVSLPILTGYWYLQMKVAADGMSASYEAYKLFAVFFPGMLAAFCFWGDGGWRTARTWTVVGLAVLVACNFAGEWRLFYRLRNPPLSVNNGIVALEKIEQMPQVASLNMRVEEGWTRLWANAFLLHKQQYFEKVCYEGRRATALKGDWDLVGNFLGFELPGDDSLHPAPGYTLLRRQSPCYIEADLLGDWTDLVRDDPRLTSRTNWALDPIAKVRLINPQPVPLRISLSAALRSFTPRECEVRIGTRTLAHLALVAEPQRWLEQEIVLPPGETVLAFSTPQPPDLIGGRVKQAVTVVIDGIDIRVLGRTDGSAQTQ